MSSVTAIQLVFFALVIVYVLIDAIRSYRQIARLEHEFQNTIRVLKRENEIYLSDIKFLSEKVYRAEEEIEDLLNVLKSHESDNDLLWELATHVFGEETENWVEDDIKTALEQEYKNRRTLAAVHRRGNHE